MPDTLKVKTPPTETSAIGLRAGLRQLLSDDTGGGEVLDMQIIAFTFIGVAYFVLEVTTHPGNGLPKIPAALLVLMGISGAGYLSGKLINPMGGKVNDAADGAATASTPGGDKGTVSAQPGAQQVVQPAESPSVSNTESRSQAPDSRESKSTVGEVSRG